MRCTVGTEHAGIEFIGINPVFPDVQDFVRYMPDQVVFVGYGLGQFFEVGEVLPVIRVFGLEVQITQPRRIVEGIEFPRFPQ